MTPFPSDFQRGEWRDFKSGGGDPVRLLKSEIVLTRGGSDPAGEWTLIVLRSGFEIVVQGPQSEHRSAGRIP